MAAPYIEAFGPPAVGKSYVTERLVKLPEVYRAGVLTELFPVTHGHRLLRVPWKLWLILRYLPTLLAERRRIGPLVRCTPWASGAAAGRGLLNWVQLLAMVQHLHRQQGAILLCQGIFQAVWSLRFRAKPVAGHAFPLQEWIELSLALLPGRPVVVLHVVAAPAAIHLRQRDRIGGQSVLDRQQHGFTSAQRRSARIAQEILAALRSLESVGRLQVVTFDNTSGDMTYEKLASLAQALGLGRDPSVAPSRGCDADLNETP